MARFVAGITRRVREALEARVAKKRAKKIGKLGISDELAEKMYKGLKKRTNDTELFSKLWRKAVRRTAVKNALQRMGITNTKKDPEKISRILSLVDRGANRELQLKQFGKERDRDQTIVDVKQALSEELGSERVFKRFATIYVRNIQNLERITKQYPLEGQE